MAYDHPQLQKTLLYCLARGVCVRVAVDRSSSRRRTATSSRPACAGSRRRGLMSGFAAALAREAFFTRRR